MKNIYTYLILAIMLFAGHSLVAQSRTVKYYSKSRVKEVTPSEAHYFEVIEEDSTGGGTSTRYLTEDSSKVNLITYSDLDGGKFNIGIKDGPSYEWHQNGKLLDEGHYKNNKAIGEHRSWYENGQLHCKMKYENDMLQDTLIVFFESGKVRRIEVYEKGEMASGSVFDETGKELEYIPRQVMPEFTGGELMLQRWLGRNIKYPKSTRKAKAQGMVFVAFVVDKDGLLKDAEVVKGFHDDADAEGLRVINSMPRWQPGLLEGVPVPVRFIVPIRFSIN